MIWRDAFSWQWSGIRAALTPTERFNHYPASPLPTLSWTFEGTLHMVEEDAVARTFELGHALPRLVFAGPQRRPRSSWSPGPVRALTVSFYPEALSGLLGIRMGAWMDRIAALQDVAPAPFVRACQEALTDAPDFARVAQLLTVMYQGREGAAPAPRRITDWVTALAPRLAFSAPGTRIRQWQRQVKQWTGQSHRELERFARQERVMMAHAALQSAPTPAGLAAIAADAGYADQSHMGRDVRRVTGFTPGSLQAWMKEHEAFWLYRLLMEHHAAQE